MRIRVEHQGSVIEVSDATVGKLVYADERAGVTALVGELIRLAEALPKSPPVDSADEMRRLASRVETARAWLEALGDPVSLMRKAHSILSEIAPDRTEVDTPPESGSQQSDG